MVKALVFPYIYLKSIVILILELHMRLNFEQNQHTVQQ